MKKLGLKPTPGSGSNWVHKEDGENEFILAQLKSTDSETLTIKMLDWRKLDYHASVSNKIPIFVNEKIGEEVLITMRPQDIIEVAQFLSGELVQRRESVFKDLVKSSSEQSTRGRVISSSGSSSRDAFYREKQRSFENSKQKFRRK